MTLIAKRRVCVSQYRMPKNYRVQSGCIDYHDDYRTRSVPAHMSVGLFTECGVSTCSGM